MLCVNITNTYTCSDGVGTTCTKQAVTIPVVSAQPTCNAGQYVLVTADEFTIPPPSPERIAEISDVFLLMLVALVSVWGVKQLLKLFSGDVEK